MLFLTTHLIFWQLRNRSTGVADVHSLPEFMMHEVGFGRSGMTDRILRCTHGHTSDVADAPQCMEVRHLNGIIPKSCYEGPGGPWQCAIDPHGRWSEPKKPHGCNGRDRPGRIPWGEFGLLTQTIWWPLVQACIIQIGRASCRERV